MSSIYDIEREIENCVDPETGEIIDEKRLDALQMAREKKIENILLWIKNLKSEAGAIREEEKKLADRRQSDEKKAESLTQYVQNVLNGEKFKTPRVTVTYRKSEAVVVDDLGLMRKVCDDYLKYKDPEPDKAKIKAALKDGITVPGCHLEERQNITIK